MGKAGIFKRGFEAVREESARQEENQERRGKMLYGFFLKNDKDEAQVRFLTEQPINYQVHRVKVIKNGKEFFDTHICTAALGECTYCDSNINSSFVGAFLLFDRRPYSYDDAQGKKHEGVGQLRMYTPGVKILSQLDRLSQRYGLTKRDYTIVRNGKGTATTYVVERGDDVSKLSTEEVKNMLPEKLRDDYDGTDESLYAIVEGQIQLMADAELRDGSSEESEEDEKDDDREKLSSGKTNSKVYPDAYAEDAPAAKPTSSAKAILRKPTAAPAPKAEEPAPAPPRRPSPFKRT